MTVYELTREQLEELKSDYFWGEDTADIPKFNDIGLPALFPCDIPDEVILQYYDGISFVNDDFGCTAGVDENPCKNCIYFEACGDIERTEYCSGRVEWGTYND